MFQYFHDGSDIQMDQLTLVARTRSKTSVPATLFIRVIPVNDETPKMVNNTELEVWAGSSATLTNKILGKSGFNPKGGGVTNVEGFNVENRYLVNNEEHS